MKRRRQLLAAAGLGPLVAPLAGLAQPAQRMRCIGTLFLSKPGSEVDQIGRTLSRESLRRAGWDEGKNLINERRYAEGEVARLDGLAQELVRLDPDLIVAILNPAVAAAMHATRTVPIVMAGATYPVERGFVSSLPRPGGNVTGTAVESTELFAKSLQILRELAPDRRRVAVLSGPAPPGQEGFVQNRRDEAARLVDPLGMTVQYFLVRRPGEIREALEHIVASGAQALMVENAGVTDSRWREITTFATQNKILSIGTATLFTSVGGAMYYGSSLQDIIDRSMSFVDRILRGAKPADLPVELPNRFDLILNLKTLRAIGVTAPRGVLLRASEVIE